MKMLIITIMTINRPINTAVFFIIWDTRNLSQFVLLGILVFVLYTMANTDTNAMIIDNVQTRCLYTLDCLLAITITNVDIQRELDNVFVDSIVTEQLAHFAKTGTFLFLGDLVTTRSGESLVLIDGQHRYAALRKLYTRCPQYRVSVNILTLTSTFTITDAFVLVNRGQPVPKYIIDATVNMTQRAIYDEFTQWLKTEYRKYISPDRTNKPRKPNVKMAEIIDGFTGSYLATHIASVDELKLYFAHTNHRWQQMLTQKDADTCIRKSINNNNIPILFAIAKDDSWMHCPEWLTTFRHTHERNTKATDNTPNKQNTRGAVPAQIRTQVWRKHCGDTLTGTCAVCKSHVDNSAFHAGHIVSQKNGGTMEIHNLRVTCATCNLSMGSQNMDIFIREKYARELDPEPL